MPRVSNRGVFSCGGPKNPPRWVEVRSNTCCICLISLACRENLVNFFCPLLTRVLKCAVKKWSLIQKGPVAHDEAAAAGEEATAATPNRAVLPPRGRGLSRKPRGVGRGGGRSSARRIVRGGSAVQEATGAARKHAMRTSWMRNSWTKQRWRGY